MLSSWPEQGAHVIKILVPGGVQNVEAVQLLLPGRRIGRQGRPPARIEGLRHPQIGVVLQSSLDLSAWTPASCHAASNGRSQPAQQRF